MTEKYSSREDADGRGPVVRFNFQMRGSGHRKSSVADSR